MDYNFKEGSSVTDISDKRRRIVKDSKTNYRTWPDNGTSSTYLS